MSIALIVICIVLATICYTVMGIGYSKLHNTNKVVYLTEIMLWPIFLLFDPNSFERTAI